MARNDVRVKSAFHHLEAFWQIELPEGFAKFQERISTPDVIDQDVQLTLLLLDPGDEHPDGLAVGMVDDRGDAYPPDRKSTRLNSSHSQISYAVFCLKKKKHTSVNGIGTINKETQYLLYSLQYLD